MCLYFLVACISLFRQRWINEHSEFVLLDRSFDCILLPVDKITKLNLTIELLVVWIYPWQYGAGFRIDV